MTQEELNKILKDHKLWLDSNMTKGKQADLSNIDLRLLKFCDLDLHWVNLIKADLRCVYLNDANLSCAILCGVDLSYANLNNANLSGADLRGANLNCANLNDANLSSAILFGANLAGAKLNDANLTYANLNKANLKISNLIGANLRDSNLQGADLVGADLSGANLCDADLRDSDLHGADLSGANLCNATLDKEEQIRKGLILQEEMIGWKKCRDNVLVKLEIPKGATVFSINKNNCRTNIAKVIEIIGVHNYAISNYDEKFIYVLDEIVEIKDFNLQYNIECDKGIHFFRTKEEAIAY